MLVLALDLLEPGVLGGQPLVLGLERRVVDAQPVDLGDRPDDATRPPPATWSRAPWTGRNAKPTPFWSSRTSGFEENAMSITLMTSRTRNATPRRRAARLARTEVIGSFRIGRSARGLAAAQRGGREYVSATRTRAIRSSSWRTTPGPAGDAGQRVVGDVDGHLGRLGDAPVEAGQQGAAAGQDDALVHDVGDQLRRGLLDRVLDRVDDLLDGRLDRLADLVRADLDAARQPGQQVAAAERDPLRVPFARVGRARWRS